MATVTNQRKQSLLEVFVAVVVTVVWATAVIQGTLNNQPVDITIHGIMGGVVGALFGLKRHRERNDS